jgi:hypothetical protein
VPCGELELLGLDELGVDVELGVVGEPGVVADGFVDDGELDLTELRVLGCVGVLGEFGEFDEFGAVAEFGAVDAFGLVGAVDD